MMTMLAVRWCVSRDPKRRYLDVVKEDKQQAGVKEDERLTQVYDDYVGRKVLCFKGP